MSAGFDPLATSELIISAYRRYLRSLLPVRDPRIAAALDAEISRSPLTKGPLLESAPPYAHGATLAALVGEEVLNPAFPSLASPALPLQRPLYRHQEQAIRKITAGRNVIVASGTGSGKTETFLLPVLDATHSRARERGAGPGCAGPTAVPHECARQRPDQAAPPAAGTYPPPHLRPLRW